MPVLPKPPQQIWEPPSLFMTPQGQVARGALVWLCGLTGNCKDFSPFFRHSGSVVQKIGMSVRIVEA